MNPSVKRHHLILQQLQALKYVEVPDLCDALQVSAVTVRKDLKLLEEKGLLFRTHGGASLENPYIKDRSVNEKEQLFVAEKAAICAAANHYQIPDGLAGQLLQQRGPRKGCLVDIVSHNSLLFIHLAVTDCESKQTKQKEKLFISYQRVAT